MACCLFGAKPVLEPMMSYRQLDIKEPKKKKKKKKMQYCNIV